MACHESLPGIAAASYGRGFHYCQKNYTFLRTETDPPLLPSPSPSSSSSSPFFRKHLPARDLHRLIHQQQQHVSLPLPNPPTYHHHHHYHNFCHHHHHHHHRFDQPPPQQQQQQQQRKQQKVFSSTELESNDRCNDASSPITPTTPSSQFTNFAVFPSNANLGYIDCRRRGDQDNSIHSLQRREIRSADEISSVSNSKLLSSHATTATTTTASPQLLQATTPSPAIITSAQAAATTNDYKRAGLFSPSTLDGADRIKRFSSMSPASHSSGIVICSTGFDDDQRHNDYCRHGYTTTNFTNFVAHHKTNADTGRHPSSSTPPLPTKKLNYSKPSKFRSSPSLTTASVPFRLIYSLLSVLLCLTSMAVTLVDSQELKTPASCPTNCFCNFVSKIVYCSRRGVKVVPPEVNTDTLQLNLNNNLFQSSELTPTNFSAFSRLEHLYLSDCGIERIQLDTFAKLTMLKWLDLSNNRIKRIAGETFKGLKLHHLFLNGNRQLQLMPDSFVGLQSGGLYLQDCSLRQLQTEILNPLRDSLRYLWLNGNELDRLDERFGGLFAQLSHLRLGSNPLHCNCELLWLKEFYDQREVDIFKGAPAPSCLTPTRLKGHYFYNLTANDMRCTAPVFGDIEASFAKSSGRLKCTARGDPKPTIFWVEPGGATKKFLPLAESDWRATEALLELDFKAESLANQMRAYDHSLSVRSSRNNAFSSRDLDLAGRYDGSAKPESALSDSIYGKYICIASNDAGNVTLTVNVSWPLAAASDAASRQQSKQRKKTAQPSSSSQDDDEEATGTDSAGLPKYDDFPATQLTTDPAQFSKHSADSVVIDRLNTSANDARKHHSDSDDNRLYSVFEMACAVIGTFLATVAVCLIALALFILKNRQRSTHAKSKNGKSPPPPLPHPYPHQSLLLAAQLQQQQQQLHHQQQQQQQQRLLQHQLDTSLGGVDSDGSHLYAETTAPLYPTVGSHLAGSADNRAPTGFDFRSYQLQPAVAANSSMQLPSEPSSSSSLMLLKDREPLPYIHPHLQLEQQQLLLHQKQLQQQSQQQQLTYPSYHSTMGRRTPMQMPDPTYLTGTGNRTYADYLDR